MRTGIVVTVFGVLAFVHVLFISAPFDYPSGGIVHIESGSSIREAASVLEKSGALRFPSVFTLATRLLSAQGVQAGSYALPDRQSALTLAYRMVRGDTGLTAVRVTIPEGSTVKEISAILKKTLPDFEQSKFDALTKDKEGYLFPETYHFLPGMPATAIVARFEEVYEEKVGPLRAAIAESGHSEHEIVTMASLLEREARKLETMKTISGILWKRIEIGMPLQVDAVFGYIFDRPTYSPTHEDLEVDSPYNTYTNRGLPPGPIANPGLGAITAALEPTKTPYLYYLTGTDGFMYYAKTFQEHVANRRHLK